MQGGWKGYDWCSRWCGRGFPTLAPRRSRATTKVGMSAQRCPTQKYSSYFLITRFSSYVKPTTHSATPPVLHRRIHAQMEMLSSFEILPTSPPSPFFLRPIPPVAHARRLHLLTSLFLHCGLYLSVKLSVINSI